MRYFLLYKISPPLPSNIAGADRLSFSLSTQFSYLPARGMKSLAWSTPLYSATGMLLLYSY